MYQHLKSFFDRCYTQFQILNFFYPVLMFVLKLLNILLALIYLIFLVFCLFLGRIPGKGCLYLYCFDGFCNTLSPKSIVICLTFLHFLIIFLPRDNERNL